MRYLKKRRAYLGTLRRLKLTELCFRLQNWLTSPENVPPLVVAPARVSRRGEVFLNLWGKPLTIWGWPLYTELRGKEVRIFPRVDKERKALVFSSADGEIWMRRFFDPEQKLFYAMGQRSMFRARIYTFHLPASRTFQFFGVELLFPSLWRVGSIVHIWVHQGQILQIAGIESRAAPFRVVQNAGITTKILVSGRLPRQLFGRVSGIINGVRLFETGRGDLRFSASAMKGKNHCLTQADAARLGVDKGDEIKVEVENGWPVRAVGPNGEAVSYLVVRDESGKIRRTMRRRLCGSILPQFAIIENLPVHYSARRRRCHVFIASRQLFLPDGINKNQNTTAVVVWRRSELLYVSKHGALSQKERALMRDLCGLLSAAQKSSWADYEAGRDFLRAVRTGIRGGRVNRAGAACLARALRRILRRIWENSTSARRRDFTALSAGAFRVEWANLARQAGAALAPPKE